MQGQSDINKSQRKCRILVWLTAPMLTSSILTFMNLWGPHGKKKQFWEYRLCSWSKSLGPLGSYRGSACVFLVSLLWTVTSLHRVASFWPVLGVMTLPVWAQREFDEVLPVYWLPWVSSRTIPMASWCLSSRWLFNPRVLFYKSH